MMPRSGDVLHIGKAASVQFEYRPIYFRVIRVHDRPTFEGWANLDGYELDKETGDAVELRTIFVQLAGLRAVSKKAPDPRVRIPQQRTGDNTPAKRPR